MDGVFMEKLWSITVGNLLSKIAEKYPNDTAIKYTDRYFVRTWKEFNEEVEKIAKGFLSIGISVITSYSIHYTKLYDTEYLKTNEGMLPNEPDRLIIGGYGENYDFYSIKGAVEEALKAFRISNYEICKFDDDTLVAEASCFHPGRRAVITKGDMIIGFLGEIHPLVLQNYEINTRAYIAKLNINEMLEIADGDVVYKPLPKFPASTRDLSLICDEILPVAEIEKAIRQGCGKILESITLFDVYQGKQIEEGKKSVSFV